MESSESKQKEITLASSSVNAIGRRDTSKQQSAKFTTYSGNCNCKCSGSNKNINDNISKNSNKANQRSLETAANSSDQCYKCGLSHERNRCPAFYRTCSKCNRRGHFAKMCRSRQAVNELVQQDDTKSDTSDDSQHMVWTVNDRSTNVNVLEWSEDILIKNCSIKMKIDTGSDVNILNLKDVNEIGLENQLIPTESRLTSYSGHKVEIKGTLKLLCCYRNKQKSLIFYIVNDIKASSLLGLEGAIKFGILNKTNHGINEVTSCRSNADNVKQILNEYESVFKGIGKVATKYHIELLDNAVPVVCSARKIPIALKQRVKDKLDQMVKEEIIASIDEPTSWVHPMVTVPKPNGDIRICLDPRNLNKYIKREHFPIPTQDVLFSELQGAKVFSKMDAASAFWQIPLDEDSSRLCTFATPFGRFRYLRLCYGLSSAPEKFQKMLVDVLKEIKGIIVYFDDILVFSSNWDDHNNTLKQVLEALNQAGVKINKEKSVFGVNNVKFLGHIIDEKGISVDPEKTKVIKSLQTPSSKSDLQRFLGLITYVGKFLPNLSELTTPLRNLLKSNTEWVWTRNEQECFENLKRLISTTPVLAFYSPNKATVLSVDASKHGIGAVILQEGHPIEYASISLSKSQQHYNQIEKELLAVVFGLERFHYYLYGNKKLTVETDHRPLIGLIKKPIDDMSPRLQRLVIRLLRYQFLLTYVPGKKLLVADSLSRDPHEDGIDTSYLEEDIHVHSIIVTSKQNRERLVTCIEADTVLQKVKYYVLNGWPVHKSNVDQEVTDYWTIRDDIYVHENVLFYGKRLLIPAGLRDEFLNLIHKTHQGIVSTKKVAKDIMFWPGMNSEIEKMILACPVCQSYAKGNPREPLMSHPVPRLPWEKIGIDFKSFGNADFIVIVDYFSKYVVVNKIISKKLPTIISTLKNVFAAHGLPQEIFTDNGPPFTSEGFKEFAARYHIDLNTSSPHYPRSNGMIERHVQIVKAMLTKAVEKGEDLMLALLNYNNTPKNSLPAPAELLMGRKLRTIVPVPEFSLHPQYPFKRYYETEVANKNKQKLYYDRGCHKLPNLKPGQQVLVQKGVRHWVRGKVVDASGPNDYSVDIDGVIYRRNRQQLKIFRKQEDE